MTWGPYWQMRGGDRNHRRYYQHAMDMPYSQSTQGSQSSQGSTHSLNYTPDDNAHTIDTPNPDRDRYGPNDHCKRHRKPDGEQHTEVVTSYRRRKPA